MKLKLLLFFCLSSVRLYGALALPINSQVPSTERLTIMSYLDNPGSFKILVRGLLDANLDLPLIKRLGNKYTIFAPTDAAFSHFGRLGLLRGPDNKAKFVDFFKYMIVEERISRKMIKNSYGRRKVQTLAGKKLDLANITKENIVYTVELPYGNIHVLNKVIVHPDLVDELKVK